MIVFSGPHLVLVGPDLKNINVTYILLHEAKYEISSPVDAIEICFKICKVLGNKFPLLTNHLWLFLEKEAFGYKEVNGGQAVTKLITSLERLKQD